MAKKIMIVESFQDKWFHSDCKKNILGMIEESPKEVYKKDEILKQIAEKMMECKKCNDSYKLKFELIDEEVVYTDNLNEKLNGRPNKIKVFNTIDFFAKYYNKHTEKYETFKRKY